MIANMYFLLSNYTKYLNSYLKHILANVKPHIYTAIILSHVIISQILEIGMIGMTVVNQDLNIWPSLLRTYRMI